MNALKKFDGRAEDYTAGRPGYALELIDYLYTRFGLSEQTVIADIGSGTGKFARYLLDRGAEVYCVEPNSDMRYVAERELCGYTNFHSVTGTAENTMLETGSVDYITVAQAFHWFDAESFREECRRIMKKEGTVFLVWNTRNPEDAFNQKVQELNKAYCPNFKGFNGGIKKDDQRIADFFYDDYDYRAFDNTLFLDREKFIARCLSSSYSLKELDAGYEQYLKAMNGVFDQYEKNGIVSIANKSVVYIGKV